MTYYLYYYYPASIIITNIVTMSTTVKSMSTKFQMQIFQVSYKVESALYAWIHISGSQEDKVLMSNEKR